MHVLRSLAHVAKRSLKLGIYRVLPDGVLARWVRRRLPKVGRLESTVACNLECPLCATHVMPRKARYLSPECVTNVVHGGRPRLRYMNFYIQGEPMMHPELFRFVRECSEAGIETHFGTNGMLIDRHLDEIFDSGLTRIKIAIDGVDPEDYERYRVGGDFDHVVSNIRSLIAEKRRRNSALPYVVVQMVMFSYNEDREEEARALLESFGADSVILKRPSYFYDLSTADEYDTLTVDRAKFTKKAEEFLAGVDHRNSSRKYARPVEQPERLFRNRRLCPLLEEANVLSDGRVVACAMDAIGATTFGNVNDEPFEKIWRSDRHEKVLREYMNDGLSICKHCTLS